MPKNNALISDLVLPEIERQLAQDDSLWPNVKGLFIITVTKRRKPAAIWYLLLQGNEIQPVITSDKAKAQESAKGKVKKVKIQVEDHDLLNFITGGLTGVKAYMAGRIKVRGDLVLAQRLEEVFERAGGRDRALEFLKNNEDLMALANSKSNRL
ncbi:isocitrate dehydrogenase (NAD(+)) idh1 [Mucor velutinosus]|uniref:Isocitrate dehydrogenase (NAD(+)) idh1 n=1 Tax=Mucor velutinosus TaxID=708070 RepID=A0AAN7DQE4_9FUNG|nr:isocitrate dehydrogenase (NAD(+)) idh1 [Mucor velutinosus]